MAALFKLGIQEEQSIVFFDQYPQEKSLFYLKNWIYDDFTIK
tara:strand:- start:77240 stop:77365 length:126 start_codon:yes stop_codon:yes gene_type:complete